MKRYVITWGLVLGLLLTPAVARFPRGAVTLNTWSTLKIGNGGVISRLEVSTDGTLVAGTDTFGGYVWDSAENRWRQLLTSTGMPSTAFPDNTTLGGNSSLGLGVDELKIDPSNSNNIMMMWNGRIFKSTNKGVSFAVAACSPWPVNYPIGANFSPNKAQGPFAAIDPVNSNVVYWGTPSNGLYRSSDGLASCAQITAVGAGLPVNVNNTAGSQFIGTDSTSLTIGTGSKAFINNSGSFAFTVSNSEFVQVWETSNPANQMLGVVTASSGTTFTLNVLNAQGSGAHSDWTVSYMIDSNGAINGLRSAGGGHRVVFDSSGGTLSGASCPGSVSTCTKNVFVHTYNLGTWKSIDAGATWTAVTATGRPNAIRTMRVDPQGVMWAIDDDYPGTGSNLDKYDTTTWTAHINTGIGLTWYDQLAVDTTQCASKPTCHVAAWQGGPAGASLTPDGGSTWNNSGASTVNRSFVSSGDVDWLLGYYNASNSSGSFFFGGAAAVFDPQNSGRLYIGGEGIWYTVPPSVGASLTLTQQTRGVEEFISTQIISSVSGTVLIGAWDFPCFYSSNFNAYPTLTCKPGTAQTILNRGYSFDYLWSNPSTVVGIVQIGTGTASTGGGGEFSGISTTGGNITASWTLFSAFPTTQVNGCIAISDANTILWVAASSANKPKLTTNGGSSWADIVIPGGTPTNAWGPIQTYATQSKSCDSDKSNGDLYLYNINDGVTGDQLYKYTKATGLWSIQQHPNFPAANINEKMKSVPTKVGHLFFTPGLGSDPHPNAVSWYYTTDGWLTKSTVTGFQEVIAFGFGATFAGKTYPSVYANGWFTGTAIVGGSSQAVTNAYGIYMCQEFNTGTGACTTTWQQIGTYPTNILAWPLDMDGDKGLPGQVYVYSNGGAFWGRFN